MSELNVLIGLTAEEMRQRIPDLLHQRQEPSDALVKKLIQDCAHTVCQRHGRNDLYQAIVQNLLAATRGAINYDDTGISPN